MTARAHRIEVDRCEGCPFVGFVDEDWIRCRHPLAPQGSDDEGPRAPEFSLPTAPPAWCPLRGSVTMVAGPKVDGGAL